MAAIFGRLRGMPVALSVLFELRQPGIDFGNPPVTSFRLMDILHNSKLESTEQVMTGLDAISTALADPAQGQYTRGRICKGPGGLA
jgi:hypothetical protein